MIRASVALSADEKPNTFGWMQIDKKSATQLKHLALKSPIAIATLMFMVERMSRTNAIVVGQKVIAENLGKSERSISSALNLLDKLNYIERIKVGTGCAYQINTRVFWQGVRGQRFAYFRAEVLASESEQLRPIEGRPALKQLKKIENED